MDRKDEAFIMNKDNSYPAILVEIPSKFRPAPSPSPVLVDNIVPPRQPSVVQSINDDASIRGLWGARGSLFSTSSIHQLPPSPVQQIPLSNLSQSSRPFLHQSLTHQVHHHQQQQQQQQHRHHRKPFADEIDCVIGNVEAGLVHDDRHDKALVYESSKIHLVVLVHGLLGSSYDLRQYRNRVTAVRHWMGIGERSGLEFLISSCNEDDSMFMVFFFVLVSMFLCLFVFVCLILHGGWLMVLFFFFLSICRY